MEEEKAAAYYEELTRKGSGAARFKQGLGFSSDQKPTTSSSSFLSTFVRASSPTKPTQAHQIQNIRNKLTKPSSRRSPSPPSHPRSRDRSRERDDRRSSDARRRRRSSSREGRGERYGHRHRRRSRERSRSRSPPDRSGRDRRSGDRSGRARVEEKGKSSRDRSGGAVDYSQLIEGYAKMMPAEKVKERMKFQLSETAAKDSVIGTGSGWERFNFDKDAPLDDEEEVETADDDASLVKNIGKSFRFSAVEAKRDEQIKAAHDEAMFGVPVASAVFRLETKEENDQEEGESYTKENSLDVGGKKHIENPLLSEKVIAMQQGSWRDRARKFHNADC